MTPADLQRWLGDHGHSVATDGQFGPVSRAALIAAFTNPSAPKASDADVLAIALRLGCTVKQLRAVAAVESSGSGFDAHGRPKMLFERHLFHRLTNGRWSTSPFSNSAPGGYGDESWTKLGAAAAVDPDAAFASASWGKFQVLGTHWAALGYSSPLALAYSTVTGEAAQYELLARYVEHNGLVTALRSISPAPATNIAFAKAYNGPGYKAFKYDEQLAEHMA